MYDRITPVEFVQLSSLSKLLYPHQKWWGVFILVIRKFRRLEPVASVAMVMDDKTGRILFAFPTGDEGNDFPFARGRRFV